MYNFNSKEELTAWIAREVIGTAEAQELLQCSRQNLHKFVKTGKLIPIKEEGRERIFFREDVLARKAEAAAYHQKK